ncbi:hypothetical protein GGR52DRAFT_544463 [Hypoxylon sp. FL1284]|nr:hypothetical protein GGR52DRAFT_544463 [Hypoxylon sp. FL1284]
MLRCCLVLCAMHLCLYACFCVRTLEQLSAWPFLPLYAVAQHRCLAPVSKHRRPGARGSDAGYEDVFARPSKCVYRYTVPT